MKNAPSHFWYNKTPAVLRLKINEITQKLSGCPY